MPGADAPILGFLTWDDTRPSGGNTYNRELTAALRETGVDVRVRTVPPVPVPEAAAATLRQAWEDRVLGALRAEPVSLVDGIVGSFAPDAVTEAVRAGRRVVVLVHMAAADEVGLAPAEQARREHAEGRALRAASAVIAPSARAARDLAARHGLAEVVVAAPGARRQPVAPGSLDTGRVPRLLALGALTPTKDQETFLRALAAVRDLPWTARIVGPDDVDPGYAGALGELVTGAGLAGRAELTGALTGEALADQWRSADLLVLTSRTETYGLVVAEALARGVPAVVTEGTGAVEALDAGAMDGDPLPGALVRPGDPGALAATLRRWLTDPGQRAAWRHAAHERRDRLPTWARTAETVRDLMTSLR